MNYTHPYDEKYEDKPEDWLFGALVFASTLSILIPEGQGILIDLKGDAIELYKEAKRVIICHMEGGIQVIPADERTDLSHGDWIHMINEENILN